MLFFKNQRHTYIRKNLCQKLCWLRRVTHSFHISEDKVESAYLDSLLIHFLEHLLSPSNHRSLANTCNSPPSITSYVSPSNLVIVYTLECIVCSVHGIHAVYTCLPLHILLWELWVSLQQREHLVTQLKAVTHTQWSVISRPLMWRAALKRKKVIIWKTDASWLATTTNWCC